MFMFSSCFQFTDGSLATPITQGIEAHTSSSSFPFASSSLLTLVSHISQQYYLRLFVSLDLAASDYNRADPVVLSLVCVSSLSWPSPPGRLLPGNTSPPRVLSHVNSSDVVVPSEKNMRLAGEISLPQLLPPLTIRPGDFPHPRRASCLLYFHSGPWLLGGMRHSGTALCKGILTSLLSLIPLFW